MADGSPWLLAALVALLVVPPVAYLLWIRLSERHNREPFPALFSSFGYGATAGVAMALLLNQLFQVGLEHSAFQAGFNQVLVASVVMAPLIEEMAKGFGLTVSREHILEMEDGIIHGAAIGLGFAATENAIYAGQALLSGGIMISIQTTALRAVSSMVLHATSAAFLGFGYSQVRLGGASRWLLVPYYFLAVGLHASYNLLVQLPDPLAWVGFVVAIAIVLTVALVLRKRVHELDRAVKPTIWRITPGPPVPVAVPTFRPMPTQFRTMPSARGPRPQRVQPVTKQFAHSGPTAPEATRVGVTASRANAPRSKIPRGAPA